MHNLHARRRTLILSSAIRNLRIGVSTLSQTMYTHTHYYHATFAEVTMATLRIKPTRTPSLYYEL